MFWITNNDKEPLIETIYCLEEKTSNYPYILINKNNNNVKYNDKTGIILKKDKKIIWDDSDEWVLAPKNIEYPESSSSNVELTTKPWKM